MEKNIKCRRCDDIFGEKPDHIRVPRMLKCGDSICQVCLKKLIKETNELYFLCPICNTKIKKKQNIDKYTINKLIIDTVKSFFNITINEMNNDGKERATKYSIVSLGNYGVGKTSLLERLIDDRFSEIHSSTIGFDIKFYNVKFRNKEYKLSFRDTAGQEKYRSVAETILNLADGVLFIYDITDRESFNDLEYWYNFYKNKKGIVVGLLIGNKCDYESERVIDYNEAKAFADQHELDYLETSAKLDQNLKKAVIIILRNIIESKERYNTIKSSTTFSSVDSTSTKLTKKQLKKRKCAC